MRWVEVVGRWGRGRGCKLCNDGKCRGGGSGDSRIWGGFVVNSFGFSVTMFAKAEAKILLRINED